MRAIQVTTDIEAGPGVVWNVVTDFGGYPDWNPFIRSLRGRPALGERLEVVLQPVGGRAMKFRPVVTEAEPGRRFGWLGHLAVPGIFDGHHLFELTPLEGGGTRLMQSESFRGILVPLLGRTLGRARAGFALMNAEVKVRAESVVREVRA